MKSDDPTAPRGRRLLLVRLTVAAVLALTVAQVAAPRVGATTLEAVYFPVTGHQVSSRFLTYWRTHGGLTMFGYPMTESIQKNGQTVQYFERARFELHPEFVGTPYEVELTLLGRLSVVGRTDAPFTPLPVNPAVAPSSDRVFFAPTGHYLSYGFKQYWDTHGGLAMFGYPISEEFAENGFTVQYFERARFEYHPEFRGTPYEVELGRLGATAATADGVSTQPAARQPGVPDFAPELFFQSIHIPVLMYHNFGDPAGRYQMPLWRFTDEMDWLQANGYHSVSLSQLFDYMQGTSDLPSRPVVLTFDDSWASQWQVAGILEAHGFKGVFFVIAGASQLSDGQIKALSDRGHEVEAHTMTHPYLTHLSDDQVAWQVEASKAHLEAITGRPVQFMAYPYGDYDGRVASIVATAGYRGALAAWGGKDWSLAKQWSEPRVEVNGFSSLADLAAALQ